MSRCPLCPGTYHCVQGNGPIDAEICFVGEAPGRDEEKHGIPFVGRTGEEVNDSYLPLAGLRRDSVRFDNAISCLPETNGHKLDAGKEAHLNLLYSCAEHHLYPYLQQQKPSLIVPMGAFACRAIDKDISLELQHGIPIRTKWGMTFPMWHPAGGLHEPKKMREIRTDFDRLRKFIKGKLFIPQDQHLNPDYQECSNYTFIDEIDPTIDIAMDTEWSKLLGPYFLTFSQYPGMARLIRASRKDLVLRLQMKLRKWELGRIWWHNWLYDYKIVTEMGLRFPEKQIRDSMLLAFHLGNVPQSLKALCYRLLGMKMQDFDDLVIPHSKPLVVDYFIKAYGLEWPKPDKEWVTDVDGNMKQKQPQSMKTKLKRFLSDLHKYGDAKDVFKTWDNWEKSQALIEEKCGPFPSKDIAHVPFEKAMYYACRDSHGTLLIKDVLLAMRSQIRHTNQENWDRRDYARDQRSDNRKSNIAYG